jgi:hypothetical protein
MPTPENVACPPCPHCHKFEHGHTTPGPPIGAGRLNAMYAVSSSTVAHNHVTLHLGKLAQCDHIHNVYELLSVKPTI